MWEHLKKNCCKVLHVLGVFLKFEKKDERIFAASLFCVFKLCFLFWVWYSQNDIRDDIHNDIHQRRMIFALENTQSSPKFLPYDKLCYIKSLIYTIELF